MPSRTPWGFIQTTHGLTATSSAKERREHGLLGDFAIELLGKLGVGEEALKRLVGEEDPIAALTRMREEPAAEPPVKAEAPKEEAPRQEETELCPNESTI